MWGARAVKTTENSSPPRSTAPLRLKREETEPAASDATISHPLGYRGLGALDSSTPVAGLSFASSLTNDVQRGAGKG